MIPPLDLSPLPSLRTDEQSASLLMEREGFVDEAVVTALRKNMDFARSEAYPEDLALAADDLDFAGWRVSPAAPMRRSEVPPQVIEAIVRRASPPVIEEPCLDSPHRGTHRWWLAGLAGLLSTLLFSVLLLTLSARPGSRFETILSPKVLTKVQPATVQEVETLKAAPELTDVSTHRP